MITRFLALFKILVLDSYLLETILISSASFNSFFISIKLSNALFSLVSSSDSAEFNANSKFFSKLLK